MGELKVVLNRRGVRQMLRSQEMLDLCTHLAYEAQSKLGEGYKVNYRTGKNRVNAEILAATPKARAENAQDNTILKALK